MCGTSTMGKPKRIASLVALTRRTGELWMASAAVGARGGSSYLAGEFRCFLCPSVEGFHETLGSQQLVRRLSSGCGEDAVMDVKRSWENHFSDTALWRDDWCNERNSSPLDSVPKSREKMWIRSWLDASGIAASPAVSLWNGEGNLLKQDQLVSEGCQVGGIEGYVGSFQFWERFGRLDEEGELEKCLQSLAALRQQGIAIPTNLLFRLLQGCIRKKNLAAGREVHAIIEEAGLESDPYLGSHLIRMYDSCRELWEASRVFSKIATPDKFAWTAIVLAYSKHSSAEQAVELYFGMTEAGITPDDQVYVAVLKACARAAALTWGKSMHAEIVKRGLQSNVFVGNALMDMYVKCGRLEDAQTVFDTMVLKDLVSWNIMTAGCAQHGWGHEAVELFQQMQVEGMQPDKVTLASTLTACSSIAALDQGKVLHAQIIKTGCEVDSHVCSTLINMYVKCGSLEDARQVFDGLLQKDLITWNTMIAGYSQYGQGQVVFELLEQMQRGGMQPDKVTIVSSLKACSNATALDQGKLLHELTVRLRLESDVFVGSTLIDMYAKCGSMEDAREVFDRMVTKDLVTWNVLLGGYVEQSDTESALQLFFDMLDSGLCPNRATFLSLLKACACVKALELGKLLHAQISEGGLQSNLFVSCALIDMYVKCGSLEDGRSLFDQLETRNLVAWNAMISGYVQSGDGQEVLRLFEQMQQEVLPDKFTVASVLKACSNKAALLDGERLHVYLKESGMPSDSYISSTLIDFYANCGRIEEARGVFDRLQQRDVTAWTAMIAGYAQYGNGQEALLLFEEMQAQGLQPSRITLLSTLKACCSIAALDKGKVLHALVIESGLESDLPISSTLIDMYAKCGSLKDAREVFNSLPIRELVSWSTMIAGYAQDGRAEEALELYQQMQAEAMQPDAIIFVSLLSACRHACLLHTGIQLFHSMSLDFGIAPEMKHYACMVDLLGRAGHFAEALDFISKTASQPDIVVWMSLLGACQIYTNVEVARQCFDTILQVDRTAGAAYVLMSNIYTAAGMLEKAAETRKQMQNAGAKKEPGRTWMEVHSEVHVFSVEDRNHTDRKQIYAMLKEVTGRMKDLELPVS